MFSRALSPLVIVCIAGLSSAMANRAMDPLVSALAKDFNVTIAVAAGVVSIYALPYAFSQPILGPLGDYYGKGRLLRLYMWLQCASLAVVIVSPTIGILMAARFFGGFVGGGIMPTSMALIGDRYAAAERQQKIGTYVSIALVGYTFSTALAGILAAYVSWRAIFVIALVFGIIAALLLSKVVEKTPAPDTPLRVSDAIAGYKTLFSNPRAKLCYGAVLLEGVALWGTLPYISPILEQRGQGSSGEAGLIITGMGIGGLLFTATVKYWLRILSPYKLMFLGGLVNAVGPFALAFDIDWQWFIAAFFLAGFGFMMVHNSIQAEVAALAPNQRASAFSMHSCALFIGHSLGPVFFTIGLATIGAMAMLFTYAALLMVIGPVVSILFSRAAPSSDL